MSSELYTRPRVPLSPCVCMLQPQMDGPLADLAVNYGVVNTTRGRRACLPSLNSFCTAYGLAKTMCDSLPAEALSEVCRVHSTEASDDDEKKEAEDDDGFDFGFDNATPRSWGLGVEMYVCVVHVCLGLGMHMRCAIRMVSWVAGAVGVACGLVDAHATMQYINNSPSQIHTQSNAQLT